MSVPPQPHKAPRDSPEQPGQEQECRAQALLEHSSAGRCLSRGNSQRRCLRQLQFLYDVENTKPRGCFALSFSWQPGSARCCGCCEHPGAAARPLPARLKVRGCCWFGFHTCTAHGSPFPSLLGSVEPQADWPAWQTVVSMSVVLGCAGVLASCGHHREPREVLRVSVPGQCLLLSFVCSGTPWEPHEGWQHPRGDGVPIPVQGVSGCGTQCPGLGEKVGMGHRLDSRIWEVSSNQNDSAIPTHQALQSQPRQKLPSRSTTVCQSWAGPGDRAHEPAQGTLLLCLPQIW